MTRPLTVAVVSGFSRTVAVVSGFSRTAAVVSGFRPYGGQTMGRVVC
jgi:hypothetical protein